MKWLKKIIKVKQVPKKIVWWVGTDAIKLNVMPDGNLLFKLRVINYRIFWKIAHRRFNEHWVNHKELKQALLDFGIPEDKIKIKPTEVELKKYPKKEHKLFNILFYINLRGGTKDLRSIIWTYGQKYFDFLVRYVDYFPEYLNVILVDGSSDMSKIYPITDCYIKINTTKYNGLNRIGKECEYNNIPVLMVNDYQHDFQSNKRFIMEFINDTAKNRK